MTRPTRSLRRGTSLLLAGLLAGGGLAGCASDRTGSLPGSRLAAAAPRLGSAGSAAAERDHAALVRAFGGEYRSARVKAVLDEVVGRLVPHTGRPDQGYAVTMLDSPTPNAFALPSGRLYLTRGLLALANDTAELAAVMAHEIAHVTRDHAGARGELEARSALVTRVSSDLLGDAAGARASRDRSKATLAGFSRAQELEADAVGIATLAAAGYDPGAAARFLRSLERHVRSGAGREGAGAPDMLATHPATAERIRLAGAEARRLGSRAPSRGDRDAYLTAIDGMTYGDNPADGLVRGRRFLHPRLGVTFEAPTGFALENTPRAVLGMTEDGERRLLFDAVEAADGQSLPDLLVSTWADTIEPASVETRRVGESDAAVARSAGQDWRFRLAAIRVGATTYRLILAARGGADAARGGADAERDFEAVLASVRALGPDEAGALQPARIRSVTAGPGDGPATLASRMAGERRLDAFLALNGLEPGARLVSGERYKLVE